SGDPLARVHDRAEIPGGRRALVGRLRDRREDVAPVVDLAPEGADPRLEPRVADRRGPHVDAAAPGAEIEPGTDDGDRAERFRSAHDGQIYATPMNGRLKVLIADDD